MAYKNLINVACASAAEVFRHTKDWLTSRNGIANYTTSGLGWTLYDSYFAVNADSLTAGDWVVLRSLGEGGKQALHVRLTYASVANSIIQMRAGLGWNTSTDAFVSGFPSSDQSGGPVSGSTFSLWVFGDLDSFSIIVGNGSDNYARYFGVMDGTLHDSTIATTSNTVTAGSNKVVTVDSVPSSWSAGKKVVIRNESTIEIATISSISGSDVTLASIANGYSSGAHVSRDYVVMLCGSTSYLAAGYLQITHGGVVASSAQASLRYNNYIVEVPDPDLLNNCHVTQHAQFTAGGTNVDGYYGRLRNILLISATGITSGNVYQDEATGANWRALLVNAVMWLFKEV